MTAALRSRLRKRFRKPPAPIVVCTGLTASWCPIHGDCACPDEHDPNHAAYGFKDLDDPNCPLHNLDSLHATGPTEP